jgi:hypothetical protein
MHLDCVCLCVCVCVYVCFLRSFGEVTDLTVTIVAKTKKKKKKNVFYHSALPSILLALSPQTTLVPLLCRACELSSAALVAACLDLGCSPATSRITPGDHTPLHIAAALGDAASVLALCRWGAARVTGAALSGTSAGAPLTAARDARGRLPRDVTTSYEVKRLLTDWNSPGGAAGSGRYLHSGDACFFFFVFFFFCFFGTACWLCRSDL